VKGKEVSGRKWLAALLLWVLVTGVGIWCAKVTFENWQDLWSAGDFYHSYSIHKPVKLYREKAREMVQLRQEQQWTGSLPYSRRQRLRALEESLDPAKTNFRCQVHDQDTSELLFATQSEGETMAGEERYVATLTHGADYHELDTVSRRAAGGDLLMVYTGEEVVTLSAADHEDFYCDYGWYSDGRTWSNYNPVADKRFQSRTVVIDGGAAAPLAVKDEFWTVREEYNDLQERLPILALATLVTAACSALLLAALWIWTTRWVKRHGLHPLLCRGPMEGYLAAYALLAWLLTEMTRSALEGVGRTFRWTPVLGVALFTGVGMALTAGLLLLLAARHSAGILGKSFLSVKGARGLRAWAKEVYGKENLNQRVTWGFALYLLGSLLLGWLWWPLLVPYQGLTLWLLCRWARQWRAVRSATAALISGEEGAVDPQALTPFPDLREHAQQLGDLGSAVAASVEERLQSERFKAELITNVSHDLKTPLTSIINYVDLLKGEEIDNPTAQEYIAVLDRKSQRLKKLTEDLVEASKASTGVLAVELEKLGLVQLVEQALGEYQEKLDQSGLTHVLTAPEEVYVLADGRHLWRVIDNLLGNCCKYALEGTRVYLDVTANDLTAALTVKNVSKEPLNIPAQRLLERFVRGDESRSAEGSGLGLAIARSLTELQGGKLELEIDGDLFKARVTIPLAREQDT